MKKTDYDCIVGWMKRTRGQLLPCAMPRHAKFRRTKNDGLRVNLQVSSH